jgi:hypothetical protein
MPAVSLSVAARELGKNPSTLRRWIAEGAPCARRGGSGRGKGALVDLDALRRWKALTPNGVNAPGLAEFLQRLAPLLLEFHRNGREIDGWHRVLGIESFRAAAYLVGLYELLELRLTREPSDRPPEILLLEEIARQGMKTAHARAIR